ncbi:protein kinase STUNTED isoform X1 [Aegilops tauschii subsp. strangulata]|uniref:protein kinase STUNTED isoform X1 n=1 Tax=Aegilops tauschii subsp. strangulata TaxID=200361 RepID=UPI00098AD80B|nr:proline-rich receptor-like protein kinase PERK1 isoform X1 [Aegilops tauschii subsp. strangulata]
MAGEGVGRCILVGLHMDAVGKELLQWALNQAARSGDRVVAVHIYRKSGDLCKTNALTLIRTLDDYLAEYEAICSKKDIVLVGRVTPGSSIQKVLVKEAKLCAAMAVVIGANKKYSFGGSTGLAKYCARKLPPTTSVVAIQGGKAIFVREAPRPPLGAEPKPVLRTLLHPSVGMEPKVIIPNPNRRSARSMDFDAAGCGQCAAPPQPKKPCDDDDAAVAKAVVVRVPAPEQKLGWPLLRRAPPGAQAAKGDHETTRKQSVVHWVMSLPRRSSPSASPEPAQEGLAADLRRTLGGAPSRCRWFRYEELYDATNHFSPGNLVGKGAHSRVYRGGLASGQRVAIKLCRASAEASKDFLREVDIITKLQHGRIVPLVGVCVEGPNLISVYRYLPRGSLEDNLHGKRSKPALPWEKRYRAAVGVAEALSYVHSGCSRPVIHRDVKSSNILLTEDFEPQLSDFGLAIWAPSSPSSLTHSDVVGTFGYLAPEYFMYGKVTDKVDVYAFGVVLLELLTGRRPITGDGSPKGHHQSLVMWATPILNGGDISDLLDPSLDLKHDEVEVRRMAVAASLCLGRSARLRPPISQILSILRGEEDATSLAASEPDCVVDDETYPAANVRSHLGLALLDVEDAESISSTEHTNLSPLEEYLRQRCSRSSSFD